VTGAASVGGRERPRLFTAIVLPGDVVRGLVAWERTALAGARARDVRPVPAANLHVTLAFLGPRRAEDIEPVSEALRAAARAASRPRFELRRYRETRSVGMLTLVDEEGRAAAFADDVFGRLEALGVYEREGRPWLPHVTVVRFRRPPRLAPAVPELGPFSPSEAAVYHSVLRPTGAQYEIVESVALGG
jgi:2'-5' RNA ligase